MLQAGRPRRCSLELELRCNRFDIEPEITAKILKRGIRIYEVPISYTGREFDEGKKITWRDGFAALWTLVKYRFARLTRRVNRPRWAAVVVNYEAGPLLADVRALGARRHERGRGRARRRRQRLATTARSTTLLAARPGRARRRVARQRRLRARREPRHRGDARRRSSRCSIPTPRSSRAPRRRCSSRLDESRALGACGPRLRNLDGSDYPSARTFPSVPVAVGHGLLGLWWPTNPFTARYRQLDADPARARARSTGSRARRSGCAAAALDEVGGWDERYFMYLEDIDLCWRLRRAGLGRRVRAGGRGRARAGREHVAPARTGCCSSTIARRGDSRRLGSPARARCSLPFAAVYFALRAVLAMGEHAWRSARRHRSVARRRLACRA